MDGVSEVQGIIDRYNEVMAKWADADYDKIGKEQAILEDKIAATDAWSLERNVEIAMDALRCALCRLLLGKSTLFEMLAGREEPDAGSIKIGDTVDLSYVDQDRDDLDPNATVYDEITGGAEVLDMGASEIH